MKIVNRIIVVVVLMLIILGSVVIGRGYHMYREALSQMPLEQKIESIKEKENYAEIEEVPRIYLDAVVSVEDHRFYQHHGIDFIAIARAAVNDIRAMKFIQGRKYDYTTIIKKYLFYTRKEDN